MLPGWRAPVLTGTPKIEAKPLGGVQQWRGVASAHQAPEHPEVATFPANLRVLCPVPLL
jgi:hypothetical protein